ncbi:MAG: TetR/AcrR family transcriptional regulator [Solirubrobacterales bacterium]
MAKAPKRIRRQPEVAEAEILDAADEFLSRSDFRHLTISGVMELTGMKRATFYSYFADRNDLMLGLLGRVEDEMMGAAAIWFDDRGGGVDRLREGLKAAIGVYAKHGNVLRAAHEASFHDEAIAQRYRYGLLQDLIDATAARIRDENVAGRTSVPDPQLVAESLVLMNSMVMAEHLGRPSDEAIEALAVANLWFWERVIYGGDSLK